MLPGHGGSHLPWTTRPLRHRNVGQWKAGGPDRGAASSGVGLGQDLVVKQPRRPVLAEHLRPLDLGIRA
jgi:hypothetical protein